MTTLTTMLPMTTSTMTRLPRARRVILPPYPFWPNDAYVVDLAVMEELGTAYCAAHPNDASDEDFFYGELPMASFNLFYPGDAPPLAAEPVMGDLYISGYFGGLWLKDELSPDGRASIRCISLSRRWRLHRGQIDLSENGADADVLAAARAHIRCCCLCTATTSATSKRFSRIRRRARSRRTTRWFAGRAGTRLRQRAARLAVSRTLFGRDREPARTAGCAMAGVGRSDHQGRELCQSGPPGVADDQPRTTSMMRATSG